LTRAETVETESAAQTEELGARIAAGLHPSDIVVVSGEVGTGKSTLIRGAARALGVEEPVISPTFTIGRRYRGRLPVSHLDLYRLDRLDAEEPGLLDDYLTPDAVAFVEWPDAAEPRLARAVLRVRLEHAGGDRRVVELTGP
jgi:tRNA threonylcarbamoyladenosine biosynthesis protein TsaE